MIMLNVKASWFRYSSHIYLIICLFIHYSLQEITTDTNDVTDKGLTDPATNKKDKEVDKLDKAKVNSDVIKSSIKIQIRQSKSTVANTHEASQPSKHYDSFLLPQSLSVKTSILNQVNQKSSAKTINSQQFSSRSTVKRSQWQSALTSKTNKPIQETLFLVGNSKRSSETKLSQRSWSTSSMASSNIASPTVLIKPTPSVVENSKPIMTSTRTLQQSPRPTSDIEIAPLATARTSSTQILLQTSRIESSLTKSSAQQSSVQSSLHPSVKTSKPILLKGSSTMSPQSAISLKILISETLSDDIRKTTRILDRSMSTTKTKGLSTFMTSYLPVDFSPTVETDIGQASSTADSFEKTNAMMTENNILTSSPSLAAQSLLSSFKISKSQTTSTSKADEAVMTAQLFPTSILSSTTRSILSKEDNTKISTAKKDAIVPTSSKPVQASAIFSDFSKSVESMHSVLIHSQEGMIPPSATLSAASLATQEPQHNASPSRSVIVPNLSTILSLSEHKMSSSISHVTQRQSTVSGSTTLQLHPSASNTPIALDASSFADSYRRSIPTLDRKSATLESTKFAHIQSTVAKRALSASLSTVTPSSSVLSQHKSVTPSNSPSNSFIRLSTASVVNSTLPDNVVSTISIAASTASKTKRVDASNILQSEVITLMPSPKATEEITGTSKIAVAASPSKTVIQSSIMAENRSSSGTKMPSNIYSTPMMSKMDIQTTSVRQPVSKTTLATSRTSEQSLFPIKENASLTVTTSKLLIVSLKLSVTVTPDMQRSSESVISSKSSLIVWPNLTSTNTPSLKRSSIYSPSPSMNIATFSSILTTKFIIKPITTTTSPLTPKIELITASKTIFATVSRNYSSAVKLSISPSGTRSTATTVRAVYPSSVTRASPFTTIHSINQTILPSRSLQKLTVIQSPNTSTKWASTFIPSVTTTTKTTTATTTVKDKVTIVTTTLRSTTAMTMKTTIRVSTTTTSTTTTPPPTTATTIPVGPTSRGPVTEKPTTEQSPTTQNEGTTPQPPVFTDPEVLTKELAAYATSINIHFRVIFPGIEEADRLQIVAQRFDHRVSGNGKILRRWFEVHYFEDYKYEPYVAGELTRKHLVQRKSFNFTIGSDLRCQRAQIRFEHCNGPLHAGSYRVRLMYRVHGIERKGTFSKVYTTATTKPTEKDVNTGISQNSITIAVIAVLAILLVIIVIVAVILYRRKNSHANDHRDTEVSDCTLLTSLKRSSSCSKSCYGRGAMTPGDSSLMLKSLTKGMSRPVHVKDFIAWVNRSQADSDFRFAEEFESIRDVGRDQSHEASDLPENRGKNRYVNVLAYDRTRVKLSYTDDEIGSDYINANYIHGYKHPRAYIATQGPLPGTTDDFWRMIWEQNTFNIVMVTQCIERSRVKCHEYWPGTQPTAYGDIIVSLLSEFAFPEWVEREFLLEVEGDGTRRIRHYQYTAWPDHGVPKNAISCMEFIHNVRSYVLPGQGPVVIHCSAGVGRTGTLIAIDTIFDRLQDEDTIDVYLCLCMMRMQRCCMVQTEDQYIFIHRVLVEYLKSREVISPLKGYCLLPKEEIAEDPITPPAIDAPVANRDSGLALLLGEYDPERADEALESVA